MQAVQGRRLGGIARLRHGGSEPLAMGWLRHGALYRLRVRRGHRADDRDGTRDSGYPLLLRKRSALPRLLQGFVVKFSVKWLQEFVPIDVPAERLAELLSHSGSKVESIDGPAKEIGGVVVSEVLDIAPHPDADNLTLVEVKVDGSKTQRVVCGARNFSVGDRVPLAQVGARLPGMEVKERSIRGQSSRGMLCSPAELGVSHDHSGILVLPPDAALGAEVSALLGLDDTIIELEVTPNRGDCMGMVGIAREVAALLGRELNVPDWDAPGEEDLDNPVTVDIRDPQGCSRFAARYVS